MNKKLFLPSIGLMALLAACSNDELFENKPISVDNDGRPQVNLILGVENPGLDVAETRMAGDAGLGSDGKARFDWLWRPTDVLGGALFSDVEGNIFNDKFLANYNFVRSDREDPNAETVKGATFKSYSSVTTGAYLFYHPYFYDGGRHTIGHVLGDGQDPLRVTEMVVGDEGFDDLANVDKSGKSKNFFFSSLNDVTIPFDMENGVAQDETLPMKFASAYSFFRIELSTNLVGTSTTNYYKNFSINKIEVSSPETPFRTAFTVNPQTIAAIQADMFKNEVGAVEKNGALAQVDPEVLSERIEKVRKALRGETYTYQDGSKTIPVLDYTKGAETNKLIYVLEEDCKLKKGEKFVLWIPVPAGTYQVGHDTWTFNGVTKEADAALKFEVYTSEGKATFHVVNKNNEDGSITLRRDEANKFTQTLTIDGDKTNIDLYSFNQGFDVATDEEWEFAINYIKNHDKEFSNRTPLINLSGDITINKLFDQKIQIVSEKNNTITLNNAEGKIFTLDPDMTILGNGANDDPILEVAAGNTLSFAKDITTLKLINNGTVNADQNVTMQLMTSGNEAVLNIEDGKIVKVDAEDKVNANDVNVGLGAALTIDATEVAVDGDMDIQGNANVTLNGTTSNTTNNVTLCPTAKLTVTKGAYTSKGAMTINAEKDNIATVDIQSANATNEGNVTVGGMLKAKAFTNATGAILTAKAPTTGEGRGKSGYVSVATLTNNGTVVTEKSEMIKNTFGGTIDVNTLNNNAGGEINTNGELVVAKSGVNNGTINLEGDEYALIKLPGASYTNNGRIVIEEPEHYCMYSYYKDWNKLERLKGNGTIETTIKNQDQYNAVLAQQAKYQNDGDKYTAWDVINKVYVNCNLNLTKVDSKDVKLLKEIVLNNNVKLSVANNLEIGKLSIEGTNTTVQSISGIATLNATSMVVNEGKQVDITKDVKLLIKYAAFNNKDYMLNVAGTLNNYGWIDTNNSTVAEANKLSVLVANNGQLINRGKLSQPAVKAFDVNSKEYKFAKSIIAKFDGITNTGNEGARVSISTSLPSNWTNGSTINNLATILTSGQVITIGKLFGTEFVGMIVKYGKNHYTFYDGSQDSNQSAKTIFEPYKDNVDGANTALHKKDDKASTPIYMVNAIKDPTLNKAYGPTWFYIHENLGTVDLLNKVWAYGEIKNGDKGTLKGQWSE